MKACSFLLVGRAVVGFLGVIVDCTLVRIQACNYSSRFTAVVYNNLASHVMVISANDL